MSTTLWLIGGRVRLVEVTPRLHEAYTLRRGHEGTVVDVHPSVYVIPGLWLTVCFDDKPLKLRLHS